jgi:hypothetical protein
MDLEAVVARYRAQDEAGQLELFLRYPDLRELFASLDEALALTCAGRLVVRATGGAGEEGARPPAVADAAEGC